jgi:hypothetical protein
MVASAWRSIKSRVGHNEDIEAIDEEIQRFGKAKALLEEPTSVITLKLAIRYQFKTGQREVLRHIW